MCGHCGCSTAEKKHTHHSDVDIIQIEQDILAENKHFAAENREFFVKNKILTINLMSSPGSGKTTLLVETLRCLQGQLPLCVIEGDQQTTLDAERIAATGVAVKQINTGKTCHLDAHQIAHAITDLAVPASSILFIENIGNLVCPSLFDLGETIKVVILSVTEGEDKPLKYPYMFAQADLMLINKIDLLPYVAFNLSRCVEYAMQINPQLTVLQTTATAKYGNDAWYAWLLQQFQVYNT